MAALKGNEVKSVTIESAIKAQKIATRTDQALLAAKSVGVSFGTKEL